MIMGQLPVKIPYHAHNNTPKENITYMGSERSLVCRVRQTLRTCGRNDTVVHTAAILAINVILVMVRI